LSYDDCPSVHSEINAFIRADANRLASGTAYVTSCPCFSCAKALSNAGLLRVVCRIGEEDAERAPERSLQLMRDSGLAVILQRDDGYFVPWS
jgi:deoxycytidylate deaminase